MTSRSVSPPRRRRLDESAVAVHISRIRFRRVPIGAKSWYLFPLALLAFGVAVAVLTLPILYFFFGTGVPFLVNRAGTEAAPETGERVTALLLGLACWGGFAAAFARPLRDSVSLRAPWRSASRWLAVDTAGVWLARGERVLTGLEWSRIKAVSVVESHQESTVAVARPPFVELFPVEAARESADPLGSLIVTAAPPAPGLRGKRYLVRVDDADEAVREFVAGVERFGPGKRVTG